MKDKDLEQGCIDHHCPEKYTQSIGQSSAQNFSHFHAVFFLIREGVLVGMKWICQSKSRPLHVKKGKKKEREFMNGIASSIQ